MLIPCQVPLSNFIYLFVFPTDFRQGNAYVGQAFWAPDV